MKLRISVCTLFALSLVALVTTAPTASAITPAYTVATPAVAATLVPDTIACIAPHTCQTDMYNAVPGSKGTVTPTTHLTPENGAGYIDVFGSYWTKIHYVIDSSTDWPNGVESFGGFAGPAGPPRVYAACTSISGPAFETVRLLVGGDNQKAGYGGRKFHDFIVPCTPGGKAQQVYEVAEDNWAKYNLPIRFCLHAESVCQNAHNKPNLWVDNHPSVKVLTTGVKINQQLSVWNVDGEGDF